MWAFGLLHKTSCLIHAVMCLQGREVTGQGQEESSMLSMLQEECELKPGEWNSVLVIMTVDVSTVLSSGVCGAL